MFLKQLFFLCFLFIIFTSASNNKQSAFDLEWNPRSTDSLELVYFFNQTRGDIWKVKWDFKRPMDEWFGVSLNQNGRVFCIDLDGIPDCKATKNGGNHLHGNLPDMNLPFLEHLFLSSNQLSGELPGFEGTPELLTLQLSGNRFSGNLPDLEEMQKLIKLDLEYNQFSGEIPEFKLKSLQSLYLGNNQFTGTVPDFNACGNLSQLFVNNNDLEGALPAFSNLKNLKKLLLFNNRFEGKLPDYYKLENLKVLIAGKNLLEGCCQIDQYEHLYLFDVSDTNLRYCPEAKLFIPDAFSPNNDGVNDFLIVEGMEHIHKEKTQWSIEIWNAGKRPVYSDSNFTGKWNGMTLSGEDLGEGIYIYILRSSRGFIRNGTVYIRR
jgi:CHU_C Type IX secretion signal domain